MRSFQFVPRQHRYGFFVGSAALTGSVFLSSQFDLFASAEEKKKRDDAHVVKVIQSTEERLEEPTKIIGLFPAERYATLLQRFVARSIDSIAVVVLAKICTSIGSLSGLDFDSFYFLATGLFDLFRDASGQSPGKYIFGMEVRDVDSGEMASFSQLLLRNALTPIFGIVALISPWLGGFTVVLAIANNIRPFFVENKQTFADWLAGTIVTKIPISSAHKKPSDFN